MRFLFALALAVPAIAGDSIEAFGLKWTTPIPGDWRFANGVLELLVARPSTVPRRPTQFAIAETPDYLQFTLEAELMPEPSAKRNRFNNSLIVVYAWRDKDHFNYAHLSLDTAQKAVVHNGIFHVYGGDRVRISATEGPNTLSDGRWHKVRMVYDGRTGRVDVWVDGQTSAAMRAVDMSLGAGKVGLGSFFDTGSFRRVRIKGEVGR